MLDIPLKVQVEEWRRKAAAEGLTDDEARQCVAAIRAGRMNAALSPTSRAKKPIDIDSMVADLKAMGGNRE